MKDKIVCTVRAVVISFTYETSDAIRSERAFESRTMVLSTLNPPGGILAGLPVLVKYGADADELMGRLA